MRNEWGGTQKNTSLAFVQIAEIVKSSKYFYETGGKTALLNVLSEGLS